MYFDDGEDDFDDADDVSFSHTDLDEIGWRVQQPDSPLTERVLFDLSNALGERNQIYPVTSLRGVNPYLHKLTWGQTVCNSLNGKLKKLMFQKLLQAYSFIKKISFSKLYCSGGIVICYGHLYILTGKEVQAQINRTR